MRWKVVLLLVALMDAASASGQVALDRVSPAPLASDGFATGGTRVLAPKNWEASSALDYARAPLRYLDPTDSGLVERTGVDTQLTLRLMGAVGVHPSVLLYGALPIHLLMRGQDSAGAVPPPAPDGAGLGDLMLAGRFRLAGADDSTLSLSLDLKAHLPTARLVHADQAYSGDRAGSYEASLAQSFNGRRFAGWLRVGGRFRGVEHVGPFTLGSELMVALGFQYRAADGVTLFAELHGSTFAPELLRSWMSPLELLVGPKFNNAHWTFGAAVGPGITPGYGTPEFRLLIYLGRASASHAPRTSVRLLPGPGAGAGSAPAKHSAPAAGEESEDADASHAARLRPADEQAIGKDSPHAATANPRGAAMAHDSPRTVIPVQSAPEPAAPRPAAAQAAGGSKPVLQGKPAPAAARGGSKPAPQAKPAPVAASGRSKPVPQAKPASGASTTQTTRSQPPHSNGAGAAVHATRSQTPTQGTSSGPAAQNKPATAVKSSPTPARAKPGTPGPGSKAAPVSARGKNSPGQTQDAGTTAAADDDKDSDGDRIVGAKDRCPEAAEDVDAFEDHDGCPDAPGPFARLTCERLELGDVVHFIGQSAVLERASLDLLDQAAAVLTKTSDVRSLRVEAHTDGAGNAAAHRSLSQAQANAVVARLASRGVARARLTAVGRGDSQPIATTETVYGRERNRRIELLVTNTSAECSRVPEITGFK